MNAQEKLQRLNEVLKLPKFYEVVSYLIFFPLFSFIFWKIGEIHDDHLLFWFSGFTIASMLGQFVVWLYIWAIKYGINGENTQDIEEE